MKLKQKISASVLALGMASGIGLVAAAPAAATSSEYGITHSYMVQFVCESNRQRIINEAGNRTTGYTPCGYRGPANWSFQIWYY